MKVFTKSAIIILLGYLFNYLISVYLSRKIGAIGFGDYSVAVAWSVIFTTVIVLGFDNYSRQKVPDFIEKQKWNLYAGFLSFGFRTIIYASFLFVIMFIACVEFYKTILPHAPIHTEVFLITMFLPITGVIRFFAEIINIQKHFLTTIIIARLQPFATTLLLILLINRLTGGMNSVIAILAYGIAWLTCIPFTVYYLKKITPKSIWNTEITFEENWLRQALTYLTSSLAIYASLKTGLLLLELLHKSEHIVGYYAAIDQIMFFLVTVSALSNQYFGPKISEQIQTNNSSSLHLILKKRFKFLAIFTLTFCLVIIFFGHLILKLFGSAFLIDYVPLVVGSILLSFTVILYINSTILQYLGYQKLVAKSFLVILICNASLVSFIILFFSTSSLLGTTICISIPSILILSAQNIFLIRKFKINPVSLR